MREGSREGGYASFCGLFWTPSHLGAGPSGVLHFARLSLRKVFLRGVLGAPCYNASNPGQLGSEATVWPKAIGTVQLRSGDSSIRLLQNCTVFAIIGLFIHWRRCMCMIAFGWLARNSCQIAVFVYCQHQTMVSWLLAGIFGVIGDWSPPQQFVNLCSMEITVGCLQKCLASLAC